MKSSPPVRVAVDARLYAGTFTGDSTYWTGLLDALSTQSELEVVPFSLGTPRSGFAGRFWSLVTFPLAARRAGCQVTHTQYALSPLARGGVTTIHDVSWCIGPEWFHPRDRALLDASTRIASRRACAVITVSETSRSEIESHYPGARGKTHAILNGPNSRLRPPTAAQAEEARARYGPYTLSIGTQWPRKNLGLAIRAMEGLPANLPHRLVLVGKPAWDALPGSARAVATGYVPDGDLAALYAGAEAVLVPSLHEGFGLPILEGFCLGCPVVCGSGGAMPEIAGDAALVLPSYDPDDWTAALTELLRDSGKLATMRERGTERAKAFSWEKSAAETAAVYLKVARG